MTEGPATPLPLLQLSLILLIQLTEPITASVIFPFINQLIIDTGVTHGDQRKTGYYAGVIESLFFLTEGLTVVQWGRASESFGRKPILLIGMLGLAIAMPAFGLSHHFWLLALSRATQGVCNGNIGVTKTVMAEISDASNIARIFGFIPLVWAVGSTVGPIVGGVLSFPAERWPSTLGRMNFFREYPYFIPCAFAGLVAFTAYILSLLFMEETLQSALKSKRQELAEGRSFSPDDNTLLISHTESADYGTTASSPPALELPPPIRSLLTPRLLLLFLNYSMMVFIDQCFRVLVPVMYSTPVALGGLGLEPYTIGLIMGIWGFSNGILQVLTFSRLVKLLGLWNLYVLGFTSFLVSIGAFPMMALLAHRAGHVDAVVWSIIVVQLGSYTLISMCYGCAQLAFVEVAPPRALSTVNGLAQLVSSSTRALAPTSALSLFAWGLQRGAVGTNSVYWVLFSMVLVGMFTSRLEVRDVR